MKQRIGIKTLTEEYFNELFRVSKNQIIWGGNYFTDLKYKTNAGYFGIKTTEIFTLLMVNCLDFI
jgi:phage antirepressor YoqD-like protein